MEHVTNLNKGLEKKIFELQQRIDELNEESRLQRLTTIKYDQLRTEFEAMEGEVAKSKHREKEDLLAQQQYKSELDKVLTLNKELTSKVESMQAKNIAMAEKLTSTQGAMRQSEGDSKRLDEALKQREADLKAEFERERKAMQAEVERAKAATQQLLSKFMDLESKEEAAYSERELMNREAMAVAAHHVAASAAMAAAAQSATVSSTAEAAALSKISEAAAQANREVNPESVTPTNADRSAIPTTTPVHNGGAIVMPSSEFETNIQQISVMMRCSELEQEMSKMKDDNQKLRRQIAKSIDSTKNVSANGADNGVVVGAERERAAALLAEQFAEVQEELDRYKKERADLKKVILIEDWITTSGRPGTMDEKYQTDLLSAYKSLYTQLDEEIAKKDKLIHKLK